MAFRKGRLFGFEPAPKKASKTMKSTKKSKVRPKKHTRGPFPTGAERKRLQALANYYDNQSDDDAIAEAKAAYENTKLTMMEVPVELVPAVEKLIARKRAG